MKDRVDSLHRGARDARLAQVGANELNLPVAMWPAMFPRCPLVKSFHHANFRAAPIN